MAGDLNFTVDLQSEAAKRQIDELWNRFKNGSSEAGDALNRLLGGTVQKKIRLTLERDESGIKQLKTQVIDVKNEIDKLEKAYSKALKTQPGSTTSLRQQLNEAKQARDSVARFGSEIDLLNKKQLFGANQTQAFTTASNKVKDLEAKLQNLGLAGASSFERLKSSLGVDAFLNFGQGVQNIVTIFQSLSIAIGAVSAPIKALTGALSNLQSFDLAFKAIGLSASDSSAALKETNSIALGLGVSLETVRNGFQKLSPVILNSGGSLKDVSAITKSLSSRFVAFGLGADQSRRVMNGVIQAFAKGKLQAEELTQQISEADPAFKTDFAKALNAAKGELGDLGKGIDGTVSNLEELVKNGQITSDVLIKVIPRISKSELLFGKLGDSAGSAVDALRAGNVTIKQVEAQFANLNQLSLERLTRFAEPLIFAILEVQSVFVDFFSQISDSQAAKDLISIFASIAQAVARVSKFFLTGVEGIVAITGVLTPFLNALAKVPGLLELTAAALLVSFVKPIELVKGKINDLRNLLKNLNIKPATVDLLDINDQTGEVKAKEVPTIDKDAKKDRLQSLRLIKAETDSAFASAAATALDNSASGLDSALDGATSRAGDNIRVNLESRLADARAELSETLAEINDAKITGPEIDNKKITGPEIDAPKVNISEIDTSGFNQGVDAIEKRIKEIETELGAGLSDGLDNASKSGTDLTNSLDGFDTNIQAAARNLDELGDVYLGLNDNLRSFTSQSVAGFVDESTVKQLEKLATIDPTAGLKLLEQVQSNLIQQKARFQDALDLNLLSPDLQADSSKVEDIFKKFDNDITRVAGSIQNVKQIKLPEADVPEIDISDSSNQISGVTTRTQELQSELATLRTRLKEIGSTGPEIASAGGGFNQLEARSKELRREIKNLYKQLDSLGGVEIAQPSRSAAVSEVKDPYIGVAKSADDYIDRVIEVEAAVKKAGDTNIQTLGKEVDALEKKKKALIATRTAIENNPSIAAPAAAQNRTALVQVDTDIANKRQEYSAAVAEVNKLTEAELDYRDALKKVENGQEINAKSLGKLKNAFPILGQAIKKVEADLDDLIVKERELLKAIKETKLGTPNKDPNSPNFGKVGPDSGGLVRAGVGSREAEELNRKLAEQNTLLEQNRARQKGVKDALAALGNESGKVSGAIKDVGKQISLLGRTKAVFDGLAGSNNKFVAAIGKLPVAIKGIAGAINGLKNVIRSLGPEIAIFATIAVVTAAWQKATENVSKINKESADTVKSVSDATAEYSTKLKELTGNVEKADASKLYRDYSALDKVLLGIGNTLQSVGNFFGKVFNQASQSVAGVKGPVQVLSNLLSKLAILGTGFLAGFLLTGGNPIGAVVGTAAAAIGILLSKTSDLGNQLEETKKENDAFVDSFKKQAKAVSELINVVNKYGAALAELDRSGPLTPKQESKKSQLEATQIVAGARAAEETDKLGNKVQSLYESWRQAGAGVKEYEAKLKAASVAQTRTVITKGLVQLVPAEQKVKTVDKAAQNAAKSDLANAKALQNEFAQAFRKTKVEYELQKAALDATLKKFGLLSSEQLKNANNIKNAKDRAAEFAAALDYIDVDLQPEKFDEMAQKAGKATAEFERLENAAAAGKLKGYVEELIRQFQSNEIPNSLENINKIISNLEQRSLQLDINSPELPKVLKDMLEAKDAADQLNGKKATITLELLQQGMENGTLSKTLANYDRQIEELNKKKISTPVDSAGYGAILDQIKQIGEERRLQETTTEDLISRRYQIQLEKADIVANLERQAHQIRMAEIDKEIAAVTKFYDARIRAVSKQRGPNEQQLEAVQLAELQKKAKQNNREGLEARAQLERQAREKQIAALQEAKARRLEELEERKAKLAEENAKRELKLSKERLSLEQKIADIKLRALEREEAMINKILEDRYKAEQSGSKGSKGSNKFTGGEGGGGGGRSDAPPDDGGRRATEFGTRDGRLYTDAFGNSIRIAGGLEEYRNVEGNVKFNVDDSQVQQSYNNLLIKENEAQNLLKQRDALWEQINQNANNTNYSTADQESFNKLGELNRQIQENFGQKAQATEAFNAKLRETSTITDDINLKNQNLKSTLQSFGGLSPIDPEALNRGVQGVTQLTQQYQTQQQVVTELQGSLQGISDPALYQSKLQSLDSENQKLQSIGQQLEGQKLQVEQLQQALTGVGNTDITPQGIEQTAEGVEKINDGFEETKGSAERINVATKETAGNLEGVKKATVDAGVAAVDTQNAFASAGEKVETNLLAALAKVPEQLVGIKKQMSDIFERDYTINVRLNVQKQGLWTGGPVTKGTAYTVNEKGQEGFMNNFGQVTPIKKPRYGTWRAPSKGLVIPADIYSQIKDKSVSMPTLGVSHVTNTTPTKTTRQPGIGSLAKVLTAMMTTLNSNKSPDGTAQLAKVQAHQAVEIGKLSNAIQTLNEKDWNVKVGVKNSNGSAILQSLNYRM